MKKLLLTATTILLVLSMLSGCSKRQSEPPVATEPATTPAESITTPSVETTPVEPEDNASSVSINENYAPQIERYYEAISNQWDDGAYFEHQMCPMVVHYYEENALDNVGFTFMDLDGDDNQELIIGAIMNSEQDPLIFEIWTLNNGEPVMLAQSGSRNRYYSQYSEEDGLWSIANEAENGAANHAVYYLQLLDGKLEVTQGILFDAVANESAPWFMAYDLDWDVSNDMPIDEDTANAVMEAGQKLYTAMEYIPYSLYK